MPGTTSSRLPSSPAIPRTVLVCQLEHRPSQPSMHLLHLPLHRHLHRLRRSLIPSNVLRLAKRKGSLRRPLHLVNRGVRAKKSHFPKLLSQSQSQVGELVIALPSDPVSRPQTRLQRDTSRNSGSRLRLRPGSPQMTGNVNAIANENFGIGSGSETESLLVKKSRSRSADLRPTRSRKWLRRRCRRGILRSDRCTALPNCAGPKQPGNRSPTRNSTLLVATEVV